MDVLAVVVDVFKHSLSLVVALAVWDQIKPRARRARRA